VGEVDGYGGEYGGDVGPIELGGCGLTPYDGIVFELSG